MMNRTEIVQHIVHQLEQQGFLHNIRKQIQAKVLFSLMFQEVSEPLVMLDISLTVVGIARRLFPSMEFSYGARIGNGFGVSSSSAILLHGKCSSRRDCPTHATSDVW